MASSLRRQVDALRRASTGTSVGHIQRKKGKPSLLLTPDQAADLDLTTVREAAVLSLKRLEAVDPDLSPYQASLLSKEGESTHRELQTAEFNDRLNKSIEAFLLRLSPYMSSREAHLCVEYLIRHYKIYQYNVDAVMGCFLPWHDTVAFARMVQLLDLKGSRWDFLISVHRTGSPLPREALARRCAGNHGLLRFICAAAKSSAGAAGGGSSDGTGHAHREKSVSAAKAAGRAKLFSFYAAVVVEALESLVAVSDEVMRALIPDVLHGLSATQYPEYQMASYMILSVLAGKTSLAPKVSDAALLALICKPCRGDLAPSLLCAILLVQSQAGFTSKSGDGAADAGRSMPKAAFRKLSSTVSVPFTLAELSQKYDSQPFLWLLLRSYVDHLADKQADHGASLCRLCTHHGWPEMSLPRLIRRLVDRMLKEYLSIAWEAQEAGDDAEKSRRALGMASETQTVLRVLGQRYPKEVDSTVSKVNRYASNLSAAAKEEGDMDGIQRATFRENALSTLLALTFAGAHDAHRVPLQVDALADATDSDRQDMVHASVMTALDHPSPDIRERATEQIGRSLHAAVRTTNAYGDESKQPELSDDQLEELGPAIIRRLHDEYPKVVSSVAENDVFWRRVLLQRPLTISGGRDIAASALGVEMSPTAVASSVRAVAMAWIARMCEPRPKHPVADTCKVVLSLLRMLSKTATAAVTAVDFSVHMDSVANRPASRGIVGGSMPSIIGLILECLPGPHMMQWVKSARESPLDCTEKASQEDLQVLKKGLTEIGREAVKVLKGLPGLSRPLGIFAVALGKAMGKKGTRNTFNTGNSLDPLCEDVCVALGEALDSIVEGELQELVECLGPGGRWLLMEGLFRSMSKQIKGDKAATMVSAHLGKMLVKMVTLVISGSACRAKARGSLVERSTPLADVFRYLGLCVGFLPGAEKPSSLFAADHLNKTLTILSSTKILRAPDAAGDGPVPSASAGDILFDILRVAVPMYEAAPDVKTSILEAISVVLQAREGHRPIYVLVALAIVGAHSSDSTMVMVAARALYFAATLVKAAAEAKVKKGVVLPVTAEEIVAVAPVGVVALTSKHKELRETGRLFISSLAGYPSTRPGSSSDHLPNKGATATFSISDGEIFPDEMGSGKNVDSPSPLCPPSASVVISFSNALQLSLDSSEDEIGEKLESLLGDGATRGGRDLMKLCDAPEMLRYLVAWGARLGRRDPQPAGAMLEKLTWATTSFRECCMPLARSCLGRGSAPTEVGSIRLLKCLLGAMLTWRQVPGASVSTPSGGTRAVHDASAPSEATTLVTDVEHLLLKALGTSGQVQMLAMEVISSCEGNVGNDAQRIALLLALVEASVGGADLDAVSAAVSALPVTHVHAGKLVQELLRDRGVEASKNEETSARTSSAKACERSWVCIFSGLVELIQALTPRIAKKYGKNRRVLNDEDSAEGPRLSNGKLDASWTDTSLVELAGPLFDAIPVLMDCDGEDQHSSGPMSDKEARDASAEYALWLTMDVLGNVLQRRHERGADKARSGSMGRDAGKDANNVLRCIRENPSPQTRNSALSLLSVMTVLYPAPMASCLSEMLTTVGNVAVAEGSRGMVGGGQVALRQTQRVVQSMIPSLRAHGTGVGIGAHEVVKVFVDALTTAPVHTRRALFGTLVDALGDVSLTISSCLLLVGASSTKVKANRPAPIIDPDPENFEFIHQICHLSGARSQVETMVKLVNSCHRMSVLVGHSSGLLPKQAYEEALDTLVGENMNGRGYEALMVLPLGGEIVSASPATAPFMSLDVSAVLASLGYDKSRKKAPSKDASLGVGLFLEDVLVFVRMHLLSRSFLMAAATTVPMGNPDQATVESDLQEAFLVLCEELLLLLKTLGACEGGQSSAPTKGGVVRWKSIQGGALSVLEALQSLLSTPSFVAVIHELLLHEDAHLRRKALQMFSGRLAPCEESGSMRISPGEEALFIDMLPSLRRVMVGVRQAKPASDSEEAPGAWSNVDGVEADESDVNRQTAVLALDVLARVLGRGHGSSFLKVLKDVTHVVAGTGPGALPGVPESGADKRQSLRSSSFLLVATLCAVLGPRAFPHLPRFFPSILDALEGQVKGCEANTSSNALEASEAPEFSTAERHEGRGKYGLLWTSALAAVGTIAASLPTFLSPYLRRILTVALRPSGFVEDGRGGIGAVEAKKEAADRVLSLIAVGVESRLLVPAVCDSYKDCVGVDTSAGEGRAARLVARLLTYVQEVVAGMDKATASAALPSLTRLLTESMDFRRLHGIKGGEDDSAGELVDGQTAAAVVALVMKLSEVELRPLFLRLCEWKEIALTGDGDAEVGRLDRRLSFYRVLDELGAALKSIFTPYFAHVIAGCREDLEAAFKMSEDPYAEEAVTLKRKLSREEKKSRKRRNRGEETRDLSLSHVKRDVRHRRSFIARLVLSALRRCFQFDRSGFVDKTRFEDLLPVIVAQLECVGVSEATNVPSYRRHAEELVGPCLAQLAVACAKDALWKALANALLLRTRSEKAGVRVGALVALRHCFEAVGEEFLALLPECLPFLSELLEDRHPEVESECRTLIKYIEGALGEPIDSYLS